MTWNRPKVGDRRTKVKFAWIPICIGTQCVWLERVTIHEEYKYYGREPLVKNKWIKVAVERHQ